MTVTTTATAAEEARDLRMLAGILRALVDDLAPRPATTDLITVERLYAAAVTAAADTSTRWGRWYPDMDAYQVATRMLEALCDEMPHYKGSLREQLTEWVGRSLPSEVHELIRDLADRYDADAANAANAA